MTATYLLSRFVQVSSRCFPSPLKQSHEAKWQEHLQRKHSRLQFSAKLRKTMDKPLSAEDFSAMENQLRDSVEQDRRYWRVNDVKCDAVHTAKSYEEFADRVAAAHLRPLEKSDFKDKAKRGWNQFASTQKESNQLDSSPN